MQLNPSKAIPQPNQWFASAMLAFSLLGSIHPHQRNTEYWRQHENFVNQVHHNNGDYWYSPPRSPAFNDLLGS
jgi:hypothetical protein